MTSDSDVSSSEDEKKAKDSSDSSGSSSDHSDSDEDKPTKPTVSKKVVKSDSDSDQSDSEEPTNSRKRPKAHKQSTTAKRPRNDSDDDDRQNRGLFETEEEYERWKNMNEKEREQEIFNRMEQADMLKARAEIEKKLARKKDGKKENSDGSEDEMDSARAKKQELFGGDSDSDNADFHRPSEVFKKKKQKNAMADLILKRNDKRKKDEKKAALSIDAVFGKHESDSDSSSSESSSDSTHSSSSSRESSPERRESEDEQTKATKKPIDNIGDLNRARFMRSSMATIVHAPFFTATVIGAFVRIQTGPIVGSKSKYRIAKVLAVEETRKVYNLEKTRTNKGIKIKFGKHEHVYRLEYVSNSNFLPEEFEEWKTVTTNEDTLPTMEHVRKKQNEIYNALHHTYTNKEVEAKLKEQGRFQQTQRNFAMAKGELIKKKEVAEQNGDQREVQRISREIEELEQKADKLDKARSADISGITWINRRNREKMKEQFLGDNVKVDMSTQDDPFTRKKGGMKVVCGTSKLAGGSSATQSSSTPAAPVAAQVGNGPAATTLTPGASSKMHSSKSANDLFELHNSIANIDFDIDFGNLPPPRELPSQRTETFAPSSNMGVERRMVSLEDYRKRKAQSNNAAQ